MNRRTFLYTGAAIAATTIISPDAPGSATRREDGNILTLPAPDMTGGKPLMACLYGRRTNRALGPDDVDLKTLSSLLWAAWGINRDNGRHVIPTARNRQEILVYAARSDGVWEYQPEDNAIKRVIDGDQRNHFDDSGLVLLYAAPADDRFAPMHIGSMYQNVGLFCASAGLANCVKHQRHDALDSALPLPHGWNVYITQSVAREKV